MELQTELNNATLTNWVKDVYQKDCITDITIKWGKVWFQDRFEWSASISFKNGNTSGEQKFTNDNLDALLREIKLFSDTLK